MHRRFGPNVFPGDLRQNRFLCAYLRFFFCVALFLIELSFCRQATSQFIAAAQTPAIADGTLRDCAIINIDRYVAVGDRGAILVTANGGKSWDSKLSRIDETLHAVSFSSSSKGIAVGGGVEAYIGRSLGVVYRTKDGGNSWEQVKVKLPRLTGVTLGPSGQWVAWGDWASDYNASVFESYDDGSTWAPVLVPAGHMQAVGILEVPVGQESQSSTVASQYRGLFIDRLGKVFGTKDWIRFDQLQLPTSPFLTYHFCKHIYGAWWIGGDNGVLYRSVDGVNWEHSFVPGSVSDRELFTFKDVFGANGHLWMVGAPGTVVWRSADLGATWQVIPTGQALGLNGVSASNDSLVLACGEGGQILLSRNEGIAWSTVHESVSRVAALSIASTIKHVGWDVLSFVQKESRKATAAVVVHDQAIAERSSSSPESSVRFQETGAKAGMVAADVWRLLPVSDSSNGVRDTDLSYYDDLGSLHQQPKSILVRRLVQTIRHYRPEVLITDCPDSYGPVQTKLSEAVLLALAWAGKPECRLYSPESGVPNAEWEVARSLFRGTKAGGLHFPKSMLLQSSSLVMGEILSPLTNSVSPYIVDGAALDNGRIYYRATNGRSVGLREPLDGLQVRGGAELNERSLVHHRTATVLKTSGWYEPASFVATTNFNPLVRDRAWEERLTEAMKGIEPDSKGTVLFDIGIKNRVAGNWNHWASAMEILASELPGTKYQEAAMLELLRFTGSSEVSKLISDMISDEEKRSSAETVTSIAVASSPFARATEASTVQQASFSHAPRRIAIAVNDGLPEFGRLLAKIPPSEDWKRKEHRYAWLISSRYRSILASRAVNNVIVEDYSKLWPVQSGSLLEWTGVHEQEKRVASVINKATATASVGLPDQTIDFDRTGLAKLNEAGSRPFLDGQKSDACWPSEPQMMLRDPWGADAGVTSLYLSQDSEFIYIFAEVLGAPGDIVGVQKREHDLLQRDQEQIRVRIDIDRDYATWFEFGFGKSGQTSDQLNDMKHWNPRWYVATAPLPEGWAAEIAIPKSELLHVGSYEHAKQLLGGDVWAISAIHTQPTRGARSPVPAISDRFQPDVWTLFNCSLPKPSSVELGVDIASDVDATISDVQPNRSLGEVSEVQRLVPTPVAYP